ncbi:titin isoform X2 [Drosophila ficusphila]|uniref:titin isoform X2 n=1 Tax=Drosophila ficusphila TaxID=30025 RepID=UPI001C891D3D|nr:titin isoform X2 [Drosophila ficusphila]
MNKKELDDFVSELKEEPDQKSFETSLQDFYEVKLTELPSETDAPKKRRIRHEKGNEVEILEIVETTDTSGEQPLYEITVSSTETKESGIKQPETPKKKTRKMKKDELDAYIQQLINAEIPVTELEKYEKIDVDGKPKKPKKQKIKLEKPVIEEGETLEVGITEHEPIEKPKIKKTKSKKVINEEESVVPEIVPAFEEFLIKKIDVEHTPESNIQKEDEEILPALDTILSDLSESLPIEVVEEDLVFIPLPSNEISTPKDTVEKKRKIKTRKGSKHYEIEIIESKALDDELDEAKVIVKTTEVSEDATDGPDTVKPKTPKTTVKKVKKEKLKEFIVNIVEEAPLEHIAAISEDITETPVRESSVEDDLIAFTTTVVDEDITEEVLLQENKAEDVSTRPNDKKKKKEKPKKVQISETTPIQISEDSEVLEDTRNISESDDISQVEDYLVEVKDSLPKSKTKTTRKPIKKSPSEPTSQYTIRVEELASETVTDKIVNEDGKEVERVITKRKLKKKEGPKEFLIDVVETYEENKPETDIEISTTEITPSIDSSTQGEYKIKIVKKRKPQTESLDSFIHELIEQEIPKTELEEQELTELETSTKVKKPRKIKKHHKKISEINDGIPFTVHEFTVQEFDSDEDDNTLENVRLMESDAEDTDETLQNLQVKIIEDKPKRRPIKAFKSKIVDDEQPQAKVEELSEVVEVLQVTEEDGTPKEIKIKKKKVSRKQGSKEQIFEITETKTTDEPLAEVTIVEVTEEKPREETISPKEKKTIKKPKKLKPEDVDSYVVNVLEEFNEPQSFDEIEQPVIEDIAETVEIVQVTEDNGTPKQVEIRKKKVSRKQGPKEQIFEITETKTTDEPLAEVTIVEVTEEKPREEIISPKEKKPIKKPKKLKPEDVDSYVVKVLEEFNEPQSFDEIEQPVIEDIAETVEIVQVTEDSGTPKQVEIRKKKVSRKQGPKEQIFEITETKTTDEPLAEVTIVEVTEEKPREEIISPKEKKPIKKPKKLKPEDVDSYVVNVLEEFNEPQIEQPVIEDIAETVKIVQVTEDSGTPKQVEIRKKKVSRKQGPKEQIFEITETKTTDEPLAEVTIVEVTEEKPREEIISPKEKKPIKKPKKLKPEDVDSYVVNVLEEFNEPQSFDEIEQPVIEDIAETVEIVQVTEDSGTPKQVEIRKKKVSRKQGPKEQIFEITETKTTDEPLAEVTIVEVTEEKPREEIISPKEKKPIKKPKKLKPEDVDSYVVNVLEEFNEPQSIDEPVIENIAETVEIVTVTEDDGLPKQTEIKKKKVSRKQGAKEQVFEITETKTSDEPLAEVTIVEVTDEQPKNDIPLPMDRKLIKKPKKMKLEDVKSYVINVLEGLEEPYQFEELEVEENIKTKKPKKTSEKPVEKKILIEEMAPTTVVENIVNDKEEEVKQVTTTKKLKKKEGPKQYLIEVTEQYQENNPEADIEIATTELTLGDMPDVEDDQPVKVLQKVKKKKAVKDDLDKYIQQLIEQEITKTPLEEYEPTEMGAKPKKPKQKVKTHHKKIVEDDEGLPVIVHEFDVEEVVPVHEEPDQPETFSEEVAEESQLPDSDKYVVGITEEFVEADQPNEKSPEDEQKPTKMKKPLKKEKVDKVFEPLEEIEQTVEVVAQPTEDGSVKDVTVKKRKVSRRKGSKEHIFEITEKSSDDLPEAEVTVVELTSDNVQISDELPKTKQKIKKPKQLRKDEVEDYVINVIDEFVQPVDYELVESEVEEVKKDKTKKLKKSPKTYEVTEEEHTDKEAPEVEEEVLKQPDELAPEEITDFPDYTFNVKEDIVAEKQEKPKGKKIPKHKHESQPSLKESQDYLVTVKSEEGEEDELIPEHEAVVVEENEAKPEEEPHLQIEETEPESLEKDVINEKGETEKQTVTKRKIKKRVGPKEEIIEIVETQTGDTPEYEVIVTTEEAEPVSKEVSQEEKPKKIRKTKKVPKDDLHDYIQKLIEQDIPKTELEKYEKIDLDEPVKLKKKPIKKIKLIEEQPTEHTEVPLEKQPVPESPESFEDDNDQPKLTFTVKEFIPDKPSEKPFEVVVLEEKVETKLVPDEEGIVKEKVVKTKKIKQKTGPGEIVHEVVEVTDKDTNESEITITTTAPIESIDQEEPLVKQKRTKKIKKDEVEDFIKAVIEEEAPKPVEPEDTVVVDEDSVSKLPSKKTKKKPLKEDKLPVDQQVPEDYEISVEDTIPDDSADTENLITVQESIPSVEEPKTIINQVKKTKKPETNKEPKIEDLVQKEEQGQEKDETPLEVTQKESDIKTPDAQEVNVSIKEEETIPEIPSEENFKISIKESVVAPKEEKPFTIQVVESVTKVEEATDDTGEIHTKVTTKRKLKRPDGEGDIEIIEVVRDDQPEAEITVLEYEPQPVSQDEKPKEPKKKTKKVKKDDIHDYIQKLIDMETPKTELEKYEKIEFEPTVKETPLDNLVDVVDKSPSEKVKKDKKVKPKEVLKEKSLVPAEVTSVNVVEEDAPEQDQTPVEVLEVQPPEVEVVQIITEEGKPVQEKTTKRVLKKKGPHDEKTFKITTIESEENDSVTVIVDEEPDTTPVQSIETQPEQPEQPEVKRKPKPKKTVKNVKKDDLDDFVKKLIEEEIPKVELEKYEKIEMPEKADKPAPSKNIPEEVSSEVTEPTTTTDDLSKPKKTKISRPKTVAQDEQVPDIPTETTSDITDTAEITPTQIALPEDTATAQITPSAQEEQTTQDDTKDIIQKTVKHKKTKPDTQLSVKTSEIPEVQKDYQISIIHEEPVEEDQPQPILEVRVIDEVPEVEESQPIVEEVEEEEDLPIVEETTEDVTKPKIKKKKIVKKKTDDHDELIRKLLEQEIEKTELEKYEKIDFDIPKKLKPEFATLEPIKIERKEQKPTKVTIVEATDVPKTVKLKPGKRKEKPAEEQNVQLPKFRLKARMVLVEYPPAPLIPKITNIGAVKDNGELSRNIEEAEEVLKFKPHKTKKIKKIKDDLEKVELEKYEKYVSSDEEPEEKAPYKKPEKEPKPKEKEDEVKLKLGKGKKKPKEEDEGENVTLKKIPQKPQEVEEVLEVKPTPKKEVVVEEQPKAPKEGEFIVEPFEPTDLDRPEYVPEELEPFEHPEKQDKPKKPSKTKYKPKDKVKPEPETVISEIVPGVPKDEEEIPEQEIKFRKPEAEAPEETDSEIKLRPVPKLSKPEEPVEQAVVKPKEEEPQREESPVKLDDDEKKTKKPKVKKVQQKEEKIPDEKPVEYEASIIEEAPVEVPIEKPEEPKEVKIKQKKPKETPVSQVVVSEEIPQPEEVPEEIPVEYKITTTVLEPEEAPKEHQVRVIDFDERQETSEEVIEEKVVTRKKKPKPQIPEEFEVTLKEPKIEETEPVEVSAEILQPVEKAEQKPEEFEIELKLTEPISEEPVEQEIKVKKTKKKPVEEVKEDKILVVEKETEEQPVEEKIEEVEKQEEKKKSKKPKSYEFRITETDAIEEQPAAVVEEISEKLPEPKEEIVVEKFDTYEISLKESEAEKVIAVEEQPQEETPQEVVLKKKPKEPEEVEAEFVLTEPKITEETTVETAIKQKKTKKPKKTEEEAQLEIKVVETEAAVPEDVVVEAPKPVIVEKKEELVEEKPKEFTIHVSETEAKPEEPSEAQFTVKKRKPSVTFADEPATEIILKESKPAEEFTEEAQIKTKKPKKKVKDVEAEELKITITEEIPQEVPIVEEVEEEELITVVKEEVPAVEEKTYKIGIKETQPEKPAEVIAEDEPVVTEPIVEEPEPETFEEHKVRVVEETPREFVEEVIEEEVKVIRKKKPKPEVREEPEAQITVSAPKPVDEVEATTSIAVVPEQPIEEEAADLKITIIEEEAAPQELVQEIEEIEIVEEPEAPAEKPKDFKFVLKEAEKEPTVEELPEEQVTIQKKKKKVTVADEVEEPEAEFSIKPKQPVQEVSEEAKIKKKSKKPVKEEEAAAELKVTVTAEVIEEPEVQEIVEEIVEVPEEIPTDYTIEVKETEPEAPEEEQVSLPQKKPKADPVVEEPEAEVTLRPKPKVEEVEEKAKIVKKKPKKPVEEQAAEELTVKVEQEVVPEPIVEQEVVEEVVIKKKTEKPEPEDIVDATVVKLKKPEPVEAEDVVAEVTLKPKAPKEVVEEEFSVDVKLPKEKSITEETSDQTVQLKKKKKPQKPVEEAADELKLQQTVIEERPIEIEEEEIVEEAVVIRKKPKKPFEPTVEDLEETEFSLSFKKPHTINEGVEEAATVLKKRPVRPTTLDEAAAELSIKRQEEEYEEGEDIEEFVVSKGPKPKPLQITEEDEEAYTVKKLKRRKQVDIPEYADVENVTFRARSTKTKEDVDQEFNIALDSYAEEEISMSGKVKLKKPIKKTFSEAADEAKIKIIQDFDDGEEPIIEEIRDDEDTIDEVEEPEEYFVEELPPDEVDFKLKPKKQAKPAYSIQDEEEEQFLIGIRHPKRDSVTYDEDSLTFKKKRKVVQQLFNEDGASLNITKEINVEESDNPNVMYSICNYIADNDEAINLVEGEKVTVVGRHSSEWWYVKKSITEEEGWVPAQYLMEPEEYAQYVQNKLHEKIDKLPVFERPGPEDKPIAPRFIEKLQPIHTPDGYTVQFECKVEGNPRPQIAWFRETAIIKPSQDFQMFYDDDNVATLIIREVFPEDAGQFTVVAKNAAGFTSSTTELIVESPLSDHGSDATALSRRSMSRESSLADILEGIPPTFSKKPKAQYVDENTNVILECRLVAVPEPDIVWTFNGEDIDEEEIKNVRIVTESDMHMYCSVVHITKVKKSQEGTYEVIATNREGEARLPITLKVRTTDKEAPQILEPLRNMVIREGESVVLSTQIVGNPPPKVTWYKDGKPVKNAKSDKDLHTLTLITPKKSEKGEYTVKAVNPLGSVETTANLTIEEPTSGNAEPPLFVERFEEQNVPQKGEIHLPAKVSGNPVPEVQWLFNNTPLFPSERIQQVYDGENIELVIKDANPETDSGDYKCIASNPIGKTSHGARVIVEVDEVTFTKKLKKTITIEEVQSLTLECETSHVVTTKWFFNGKELSGMDHRVVVEDGKTHKLVIRNTNLRDSGTYMCKVKKQETQSTVEVLKRKPDFIKILEDYEVTEKDTAILDVELTTESTEVTWYKDGEKITPENKNVEFIKDGKARRLVIRDTTIHDEGQYTCKIEGQECSCELVVIELPPEIIEPLKDVSVTKGENAIFKVELSKGDALVKWFKNGKEIVFNDRIQLAIDGKRQSLRIVKAKPEDKGEYSVQVGEQTSKGTLTVEEPLVDFVIRLPDVTLATKTTDAEFTVQLSQPDVEVTWCKKGKPIKPDNKHEVFVEGTVRRLVIHDASDDDAGEISCVAENVTSSSKLCVEELKLPPVITSDKDQTIKAKENDDVTFTVKYTGVPTPEAVWTTRKVVIPKSKRTIPAIDEQSATLTIKKVVDEDEGEYTVKLVNPVGEAEASLHLVIMRKPTAPGTPQPLEIMHDSITLYWKAPEDDGKSEIIEYILEYHDVKEEKWTEIRKIKDTTYTISKLKIDTEYVFRSIAVNEVGPSPPSPLSPPIRLVPKIETEAPSVREPLQDVVSELDKEVTLSCVFGGIPEPKVTWKKNGKVFESSGIRYENRVAKYIIEKTTIETEATYTCVATNEKGSVETSCHLKLQQKPVLEVEDKYLTQKLRTGSTLTIPATVRGYPQPTVTWHKETVEQKTTKTVTIETTEYTSTYTVKKVTREQSGKYKVTATNESGSTYVECTVQVIDKPSRPQSLEIKDIKKDSITLEWTPPIDDGGLEINKYTLEKCDVQNNVWMKVSDFDKDIKSYSVQKLSMNSQYMFRVVAANPIGESEPTESDPVTITKKFEKPSPPRGPTTVSGMNDTSFNLAWEPSENDGGSKILEYIVEIREETETTYRSVGETLGTVTNIHVEKVVRNKGYLFRIFARNQVGTSEAFETTEKVVVGRKITNDNDDQAPPSPPQNLRAPDVTSRSVTLDWEVPARNGGSEITGYCVEKRSSTSTSWTKVITLDAHQLHYTIDNLKEKCGYWFRVSAENEVGLGAPAVTESISLKTHATVPSPPTGPLEARVLAANAHIFEWGIPESDGGAPLLGYHIAIRDMKKTMWIEVGRVPAGVQKFQIRDLQENHEYMIRIFAKNEIGLSEPLESEEPYKAMTAGHESLPDEPRTEMSSCNTSSWLRDHNMDADIHSYARGRLLQRDEYFFRLWADLPKSKKKKGSK